MEKQEKNQLKELLKKYLDSTPMDSNQSSSANNIINMLDTSSENVPTNKKGKISVEDLLKAVELHEKISGKNSSKKSATELSKDLEEAKEFLKYVTNMYANAFGIDESELEDSDNDDSYEDSVSVFDLDIKEADDISDNLYDWGLEDADVNIDKDGNVLVYGLLPDDVPHFTEAFDDAFSKDMSKQDITDYLKDAYNRYNSNKPIKDSYEEGYPIGDDLRNGRVFLKDMVVKFPHMDAIEEEYELFPDATDNKYIDDIYHYYIDGVKYIISKLPEEDRFSLLDKRFPLYDTTPLDGYKQLPFAISLDKMLVITKEEDIELDELKSKSENYQYYSFEVNNKLFIIYHHEGENSLYLHNVIDL